MFRVLFDGACRGNPGPGGCGFVIYSISKEIFEESTININKGLNKEDMIKGQKMYKQCYKIIGTTTNNVSEYNGLFYGMQTAVENNIKNLQVFGDSQLVIRQMTGQYQVKNPTLKLIYTEVKKLECHFNFISYHYIPRDLNWEADAMANKSLDN